MADEYAETTGVHGGPPRWIVLAMAALAVLAVTGIFVGWRGSSYAQDSRQALTSDMQTMKQDYGRELGSLQQRLAQAEKANTELRDEFQVVTKRLRITQGELKKARLEAQQIREDDAKQMAAMDTEVKGQLATKASTDDVKAVSSDVSGVRTDLDTTKKDLQMARSEMGTLIAKNHSEIDELRRLGERDYIEFTIAEKNKPQAVGTVTVELHSTNPKKNQFNLALVADDKRTEKRNRTINEPIFFYTRGAKQPMELVVNQVEKNKIVGYLSVPKVQQTTTTSGGN
jgi:chromosome segregation ATPase